MLEYKKLPGPSSTDSGLPVLKTGSPTETPAMYIIKNNHLNVN